MPPVLGIHSQTHLLIHVTQPGTSSPHSPIGSDICMHAYISMSIWTLAMVMYLRACACVIAQAGA